MRYSPASWPVVFFTCTAISLGGESPVRPIPIIFDTDVGNDVDDVLALGVLHGLQSRNRCQLLAVTITKEHDLCAPFVDAVNTFYGRGDIPIGVVRDGVAKPAGKFLTLANAEDDGSLRYPHDLGKSSDAADAVTLLRQVLAGQQDGTVVIVQVGFSTNLARLLDSRADDASPLAGRDLVKKKVRLLSIMAGAFALIRDKEHREFNVVMDIPSAQSIAENWPSPILYSGFEIGLAIRYPAESIENDYAYVDHHPLAESYRLYQAPPHHRPTWDLTSVLVAVEPDRGYFDASPAGWVEVLDSGVTRFAPDETGRHRYLTVSPEQQARVREALAQLASQPPLAH